MCFRRRIICVLLSLIILSSFSYALAGENNEYITPQINGNEEITPMYIGDAYIVIPTIGVNVRQGPGIEYKKIGTFAYNTIVYEDDFPAQDTNGEWWLLVSSGSLTGWGKSEYLDIISAR